MATVLVFGLPEAGTNVLLHLAVSHPRLSGPRYAPHLLDAVLDPYRKRLRSATVGAAKRALQQALDAALLKAGHAKNTLVALPLTLPAKLGHVPLIPPARFADVPADLLLLVEAKTEPVLYLPEATMLPKGFASLADLETLREAQAVQRALAAQVAAVCGAPLRIITLDRHNLKDGLRAFLEALEAVAHS